jgi:phosphoribosylformylglycinamidine synthase subunit PurQ / glutaminase
VPSALIITAAGINCERELAGAFELAGARPEFVHLKRLLEKPALLERYELIGLPGGFSYGDAIAAGRIAAQLMRRTLYRGLQSAIARGVPVIAPCNGFQIAVQIGLLPGTPTLDAESHGLAGHSTGTPPRPSVSLAPNAGGRFIDRWCRVEIPHETKCIWSQGMAEATTPATRMLPIAHGEGRFLTESESLLLSLRQSGQVALRYAADDNPNGSVDDIAGICDASGLVLGLMPHPERYTRWTQHPAWTRLSAAEMEGEPLGLLMFRRAVEHVAAIGV